MTPELWQRLKPLYHAALEMTDEARTQFVAEACGDDDELKKELATLLKANAEQTRSNNTTPIENLRDLFPAQAKSFVAGELILGRFRIVRHLGSGGMGDVYEATDLELGRIALKTIRANIAGNPEMLARFKREVQLARKVSGPHVCRIHELFVAPGSAEGSHPAFLTMEFLEGITLADKISQSGALPWREAKAIAQEICAGLQTIHEAGVIHRDLKCRNIMLAERSGRTCAVLMDFGLASEVSGPSDVRLREVTLSGAIMGTPNYMAPEQFEGETLSPATDVYALGVVLYEMLTGKQPFAASTPIAAAVQRGRRLNPVSSLQPRLSPQWDEIIGKCLEFKAEDRYQSAVALQRHLEVLQPSGIKSFYFRASSPLRRMRKLSPLRLGLFTLLAGILVAGAVFGFWRFYPHKQPFASLSTEQITESGDITDIAMSPDGKTLAEVKSTRGQHAIWIRNISTGREIEILPPVSLTYGSLIFSKDGNELYFVREDGDDFTSFNLYNMPMFGGEPRMIVRKVDDTVRLSPDEKRLAYTRFLKGTSEVHIVTLENGNDSISIKLAGPVDSSPQWSPDGRSLAWLSGGGNPVISPRPTVALFDLALTKMRDVPIHSDDYLQVSDLRWLPSGKQLLLLFSKSYTGVRNPGSQIGLISIDSGDFRQLTNDMISHNELALSADGKTIATLLQQSNSEIGFYSPPFAALTSTARLPTEGENVVWLDEDKLLTSDPFLGTLRRDGGEFRYLGLKFPPDVHEHGYRESGSLNATPTVCGDGQLILTGEINNVDQLYIVNSYGQFVRALVKIKGGNAFCNKENNLVYYTKADSQDPSIWAVPFAGGAPRKLMSIPHAAPIVYSSDGKLAAYVLDNAGRSVATILDLDHRKVIRELPLTNHAQGTLPHFTSDASALTFVEQQEQGFALAIQPIDGSAPRVLTAWFKDPISDFGWSPSGKILAIMWEHSTSDVALISDKSAKPVN